MNTGYLKAGRRKNAVARVRMSEGTGKIVINDKTVEEYFKGLQRNTKIALKPIEVWSGSKKYDIYVNVNGGGVSGQAGAVRHGIARSLLLVDDSFRVILKEAGLLTRDPRMKERKKYGLKKARKAPQFSKR